MMTKEQLQISKRAIALVLLVTSLTLLLALGAGTVLRNVYASFLAPIDVTYVGLSRDALQNRLKNAEAELMRIRYQAVLYELVVSENRALRNAQTAVPVGAIAKVIARPPKTHYDTLLIDVGVSAGIRVGDIVAYEAFAIGRISSLSDSTALVTLFSSPNTSEDVLLGEPAALAISRGLGGGALEVSVPQGIDVKNGSFVRLPSRESLAIGIVLESTAKETDVTQIVRFSHPVSLATLEYVRIVPNVEPIVSETVEP